MHLDIFQDSLQDQVLELKRLVLQTTQQGISDETAKWRSHTQELLTQMLNQHGKDSSLLVDLVKLSIHELPKKVVEESKERFQPSALSIVGEPSKLAQIRMHNVYVCSKTYKMRT